MKVYTFWENERHLILFNVGSKIIVQLDKTRMHSSRMRTVRNRSRLVEGGWSATGRVPALGGSGPGGCLIRVGGIPACTQADLPPLDRQTGVKT